MTRGHRVLGLTAALLGLVAIGAAVAGPVTDQVKGEIDAVLRTLEDPALKSQPAERRQAIRAISNEIFDWPEMARRSLGRHWNAASPAQREEFTRLFTNLVESAYIGKIESYSGEKIDYVGEAVEGDHATVRTRIRTKGGQEVPVDYRLHRQGDRWSIYDVSVEGISLVNNYRAQFDRVLASSPFPELLRRLQRPDAGK
jgi:phospholipid transport system substrate-binding protein